MGCAARREAARERVARLTQRHGTLRQCPASEADGAAARTFAAEGGATGGLGPGDCARTFRRNVLSRARERCGKRSGAAWDTESYSTPEIERIAAFAYA